ncbi:hypothetical protein JM93_02483 [Roseibium hamelinense]|uniref:Hydroxymethylpyrimidine pyrophosphatase-like HAD family hydrolase n=1 Tax=Roseibium hamelinense TaxID=150831 RepID=A0A562T1R2_9HYPH|nr:HAD hydrolase family protein [Roseibium hamelinense]MTI44616.1 hypothetical protein [Roseibium hamelinense]TWI87243.1 hypothetical protein JM93_02483 [Roseibium hamelinense]
MAVFVFDLDGTICFSGNEIADPILQQLWTLIAPDRVVIASARHPVNIMEVLPSGLFERFDIIGANGAVGYQKGKLVYGAALEGRGVLRILAELDRLNCAYLAYGTDFVVFSPAFHSLHARVEVNIGPLLRVGDASDYDSVIKILVLPTDPDGKALSFCQDVGGHSLFAHQDGTFDIMARGITKAGGLLALGYSFPVDAAFGNDSNDVPLLRIAKEAVCVGDHAAARSEADHLIEDGPNLASRVAAKIAQIRLVVASPHGNLAGQPATGYGSTLRPGNPIP